MKRLSGADLNLAALLDPVTMLDDIDNSFRAFADQTEPAFACLNPILVPMLKPLAEVGGVGDETTGIAQCLVDAEGSGYRVSVLRSTDTLLMSIPVLILKLMLTLLIAT